MAEIEELKKKLEDYEKRILKLEDAVFVKKQMPKKKKSLQGYILEERDKGYFSIPRIAKEVHKKVNIRYPCEFNRVAVALARLRKKGQLRKASKKVGKKMYAAYVW